MNLDEYLASSDPNIFWKLSCGDHLNLLEEALERLDNKIALDRLNDESDKIVSLDEVK